MKIYHFNADGYGYVLRNSRTGRIEFVDEKGAAAELNSKGIDILYWQPKIYFGEKPYKGSYLKLFMTPNSRLGDENSVEDGKTLFVLEDGSLVDLPTDIRYAYINTMRDSSKKRYLCSSYYVEGIKHDMQKNILFDTQTGELSSIETDERKFTYSISKILENEIFILSGRLYKLSKNFEVIWKCDWPEEKGIAVSGAQSKQDIFHQGDSVVVNLLTKRKPGPNAIPYEGLICSFFCDSGKEKWRTVLDARVEDLRRWDEQHFIAYSDTTIYLIDAETGVVKRELDSGLSGKKRLNETQPYKAGTITLTVTNKHLYISSFLDMCVQIRDLRSLELLRTVDLSEYPYYLGASPRVINNKVIFRLECSRPYSAWLVVDDEDVQKPLEIEQGPDLNMALPDESDGRIRMEVDHPYWGDVVRFVEWHGMKEVSDVSNDSRRLGHNPYFNGQVHLVYKGYSDTKETVADKLDFLKQRFENYAESNGFCSGTDESSSIEFRYELR